MEEAVRGLTNTMSVRSLKHNYKFFHMVEDLLDVLAPTGVFMVSTDLDVVSNFLAAASRSCLRSPDSSVEKWSHTRCL